MIGGLAMIKLKGKFVKVNTREEVSILFTIARNSGLYYWNNITDGKVGKVNDDYLGKVDIPGVLYFESDILDFENSSVFKNVYDLFDETESEMTASEFIKNIIAYKRCDGSGCQFCAYSSSNTKCGKNLCNVVSWNKDTMDEILEIAKRRSVENNKFMHLCILSSIKEKYKIDQTEEDTLNYMIAKLQDEIKDDLRVTQS